MKKATKKAKKATKSKVQSFKLYQHDDFEEVQFIDSSKKVVVEEQYDVIETTVKDTVGSCCYDGLSDAIPGFKVQPGKVYLITITETDEKPETTATKY